MPSPGDGIHLRSSARTSVGQVRENNEDSVYIWPRDHYLLAVVADGMGGAAAGEEASQMTVEAIQAGMTVNDGDAFTHSSDTEVVQQLQTVIQNANLAILRRAISEPEMRGMGTTVTLALVRGYDALIAHVGDSRAYRVDGLNNSITQITADHSFVEALLAAGHITPEQAQEHPMRNVLYRALGQAEDIDIDLYRTQLQIGDRLVLCSDGLTRHLQAEEIAQIVLQESNPERASDSLIKLANERGGEDNISVVVVTVESQSPADEHETCEEIAFAAEEDDDDTLVLKDRSVLYEPLQPPQFSPASSPQNTVRIYNCRSKYNPDAEHIHDNSPADNRLRRESYITRPLRPIKYRPLHAGEGDSEGYDTHMPEQ